MIDSPRKRVPSEVLKRGYSDEEINIIYGLGRLYLENGEIHKAQNIMAGLVEVAPEFYPSWLGLAYVHVQNKNFEAAISACGGALRADPNCSEAMLYLAACQLATGDFNSAGTYLGEVGERIEGGVIDDPSQIRFYKAQLARYQNR